MVSCVAVEVHSVSQLNLCQLIRSGDLVTDTGSVFFFR